MSSFVPIAAALIAAFLGSWIGALVALSRFKKERAFDTQLDWYERMIRSLYHMAQRIDIAMTFQDEPKTSRELLLEVWEKVQGAHLELERFANEAALYASDEARKRSGIIIATVQGTADETEAFDPCNQLLNEDQLERIRALSEKLVRAAAPLAKEARRHLGIK